LVEGQDLTYGAIGTKHAYYPQFTKAVAPLAVILTAQQDFSVVLPSSLKPKVPGADETVPVPETMPDPPLVD